MSKKHNKNKKNNKINKDEQEFMKRMTDYNVKLYTLKELREKHNVESVAFNACLCTDFDTGEFILYNEVKSPGGNKFYYRSI